MELSLQCSYLCVTKAKRYMTTITEGTRFKVQDTDVDMENFIFTIDSVDGNDVIVSWDHESDKGDTMYHLDMVNHFFKKGDWVEVK